MTQFPSFPRISFDENEKLVVAEEIPAELEERVRFACENCPAGALSVDQ